MGAIWWLVKLVVRVAWTSAMVLVPLFGFWLASSVAAYQNASTWLALAIGLALFPIVPVAWELVVSWRRRRRGGEPTRAVLTRLDRLVLRTLVVNGLFLGVMLARLPHVAFRALAVRGDWMLDGADGDAAARARRVLLDVADRFEKRWHVADDAYGDSDAVPDNVKPVPPPVPPPPGPVPPPDATPVPPPPTGNDGWPVAAEPDVQISDMPADAQASIASVGAYVLARFPDEHRRVKALHDFVVLRLSYDHASAAAIGRHDHAHRAPQDAEAVFARRTAVCEGYARLMVALGRAANVDIAYVTGYARDADVQAIDQATDDAVRASLDGYLHAWNAARIDGTWTLIDATWDDDDDAAAAIHSTYLFTPPALFAAQHLPDLPSWQLLPIPVSAGEFVRRPLIVPAAAPLGVTLVAPTRSQVTVDGAAELVVDNPKHATVGATYKRPGEAEGHPCGHMTDDAHPTLRCELPPSDTYQVELFGGVGPHARRLAYLGSISVNTR